MVTENVVHIADFAKPASTKLLCTKCGATGEIGCHCGPEFIREVNATRKFEQVVEARRDPANAAKSDRALAKELGVSDRTVNRARQATATNVAVGEKRIGLDGKARQAPRYGSHATGGPAFAKARDIVRPFIERDEPFSREKLAKQNDLSVQTIEKAAHAERAVKDAQPKIDRSMLSTTAQEKLDAAIRQERKRLEIEYEQKRRAEVEAHIKRIAPQLEEEQLEASRLQVQYREMMREKAIFTADEYKTIVMCLHPDNSASRETRNEGFRIFTNKKLQLTGKE